MKAFRDLTLLCALLMGLFWVTSESSPSLASSSELITKQLVEPVSAEALLPSSSRIQIGPQRELLSFQQLPSVFAQKNSWLLHDAFAPLNALGQAWAYACVMELRQRLLFPFHEFS